MFSGELLGDRSIPSSDSWLFLQTSLANAVRIRFRRKAICHRPAVSSLLPPTQVAAHGCYQSKPDGSDILDGPVALQLQGTTVPEERQHRRANPFYASQNQAARTTVSMGILFLFSSGYGSSDRRGPWRTAPILDVLQFLYLDNVFCPAICTVNHKAGNTG